MATETVTFKLREGATFTQTYEDQGTVIHTGGTSTGTVSLTPRQAQVLKAGTPGSIFEPVGPMGQNVGHSTGQGVGQGGVGVAEAEAGQEGAAEGAISSGVPAEAGEDAVHSPASDTAVTAFLSKPAKEIVSALEAVQDPKFVTLLHAKETAAPKPRQVVIDALNSRYDALQTK